MVETIHPSMADAPRIYERAGGVIEIHELHPRETAIIRLDAPPDDLQKAIPEALAEVAQAMQDAGVELAGPPYTRYVEWGPDQVIAEVGFPVLRPAPKVGRVIPGRLPGGRVASVVHVGPYETIADTYGRLERRLSELGHGEVGPMWECYWSDPQAEPDPATWRTEIITPIDPQD